VDYVPPLLFSIRSLVFTLVYTSKNILLGTLLPFSKQTINRARHDTGKRKQKKATSVFLGYFFERAKLIFARF